MPRIGQRVLRSSFLFLVPRMRTTWETLSSLPCSEWSDGQRRPKSMRRGLSRRLLGLKKSWLTRSCVLETHSSSWSQTNPRCKVGVSSSPQPSGKPGWRLGNPISWFPQGRRNEKWWMTALQRPKWSAARRQKKSFGSKPAVWVVAQNLGYWYVDKWLFVLETYVGANTEKPWKTHPQRSFFDVFDVFYSRDTGRHGYFLNFHIAETAEIYTLLKSLVHIIIKLYLPTLVLAKEKQDQTVQEPMEGIPLNSLWPFSGTAILICNT